MTDHRFAGTCRWLPQTVRLRLSLLYAGLFLCAGAVLLGLTYGLVASSLTTGGPAASFTQAQLMRLKAVCKASELSLAPKKGKSNAATPERLSTSCRKLESVTARLATMDQRARVLDDLLLFSLIGLGVLTVASGGLGWVMAGRVLSPVTAITGAARRASERHLGERLNLSGPEDELKKLADTFDGMLDRLDAAFASQQRFVADASHELRTPLTIMGTAIDVTLAKPTRSPDLMDAMATRVRRSIERAESLVEALLTLAVSEREITSREVVNLATLADDAIDAAERGIADRCLTLTRELTDAETRGDALLLERLVGNLVDNAVLHNSVGGWLQVRTGTSTDDPWIVVANSGGVIAEDLVESLFEPFRTAEGRAASRSGFGLGLAIVKSITKAHGATLEADARQDGGLSVMITFRSVASQNLTPQPGPHSRGTIGRPRRRDPVARLDGQNLGRGQAEKAGE